jgi:hypothetical protein
MTHTYYIVEIGILGIKIDSYRYDFPCVIGTSVAAEVGVDNV